MRPVMPGMAAVGMKTAARMRAIATTGPPTSSMAFTVADFGIHALVDVVLDGFDHDDGVVHHEADRQHEAEERQRVDGKPKRRKDDERSDERDRNRQQRNERGAPALKEDEDNDDHEAERFKQREHNLVNAGGDRLGGIERNAVGDAGRESGREFLHALVDGGRGLDGIGPGQLVDRHDAGGRLVVAAGDAVRLIAQFDARYVAEVQDGAIGVGAEDDVAELLGLDQAALRAHRVGELLALRNGLAADLAGGVHVVLGLDCGDDFRRRDAELARVCPAAPTRAAHIGRRRPAHARRP